MLPVGAEVGPGGVRFRVYAPARRRVEVVIEEKARRAVALAPEADGYFAGTVAGAGDGKLYRYRLDGGERLFSDPASRFQPEGPHGPSRVVDPSRFAWTDGAWRGIGLRGQVLYEMHVGTFTREGTWEAAARELPALAALGVTAVEVMPVADFPGRFGWGYDGVNLFAPTRLYGEPDDLRRFVDRAHATGLGVILDVVYNHFGPDGNYLAEFSRDYLSTRHKGEWGDPLNFDGPRSAATRELIVANAGYWIAEFHLDGLRLDATQAMLDDSAEHILAAIGRRVREAAGGRATVVIGENEPQRARLARPAARGGLGLDALWNDDFHHSAVVALTGRREAYYTDHRGAPQELVSAAKRGFLFQGQRYAWQKKGRGEPALDLEPAAFIHFLENHDQIANSAAGRRIDRRTSPGRLRAMTALLLLGPQTPLLFQGQEFAASSRFLYFADHEPDLAALVREGRIEAEGQFPSAAAALAGGAPLADPADPATFERSKLDLAERERPGHAEVLALHRDLLRLRREEAVFAAQRPGGVDGAVLAPEAFALRFFGERAADDRLLLVNLGADLGLDSAPDPLVAPPAGCRWALRLSTEEPRYDGLGAAPFEGEAGQLRLAGHSAIVLAPRALEPEEREGEPHEP